MDLSPTDTPMVEEDVKESSEVGKLGQFTASALAGNDILGGVFYTLPAIVAASGV